MVTVKTQARIAAAPASAEFRTIEQDLAVAERYWHIDAGHPCSGRWHVIPDTTLPTRGFERRGEATGIGWIRNDATGEIAGADIAVNGVIPGGEGARFDWYIERCEFKLDPTITGCAREAVIKHELGHYVVGPLHEGRMAPRVLRAVPCSQPHAHDAAPRRAKRRAAYPLPCRRVARRRAATRRAKCVTPPLVWSRAAGRRP